MIIFQFFNSNRYFILFELEKTTELFHIPQYIFFSLFLRNIFLKLFSTDKYHFWGDSRNGKRCTNNSHTVFTSLPTSRASSTQPLNCICTSSKVLKQASIQKILNCFLKLLFSLMFYIFSFWTNCYQTTVFV